jgi:ubiquinone/menaquinone biosynthesis C-methylase UbiE
VQKLIALSNLSQMHGVFSRKLQDFIDGGRTMDDGISQLTPTIAKDPAGLFSRRSPSYDRFIRFVLYRQGLCAYFRRSPVLRSDLRVLDAGCGTGAVTLALRQALLQRDMTPGTMHAFDLTPAMLERFRKRLVMQHITGVDMTQADVLRLDQLPNGWNDYDLVVTASMLEYVPRERFVEALIGLRRLLSAQGHLILFITKRSWLMRPLIGQWWESHLYDAAELKQAFTQAGFGDLTFGKFPFPFSYLDGWGHIVEATPRRSAGVETV